jgi:hypothetical protein
MKQQIKMNFFQKGLFTHRSGICALADADGRFQTTYKKSVRKEKEKCNKKMSVRR